MILYSDEEEAKSHFVSKLQLYRRPFLPQRDIDVYRKYLADHFSCQTVDSLSVEPTAAAIVDYEMYGLPVII